ncbi:MAG: DUF4340 domain-containing protein [Oscillospiraceae bacterium]|jgi:hypothetical protein
MKRRKKTLIALVAVLVICVASYIAVSIMTAEPEAEEAEKPNETVLGKMDVDKINYISITYGGETNEFVKSGEGVWSLKSDPSFPLDLDQIDKMINVLDDIRASTIVTRTPTEADLSQFGFDEPSMIIEAGDSDGNEATYTFGDLNSFNNQYYMLTTYTEGIFMETQAFTKHFSKQLNEFAVPDPMPSMLAQNVMEITVEKGGETAALERYDADNPQIYTDSYKFIVSSSEPKIGADNDMTEALLNSLTSLETTSCYNYKAGEDTMKQCGITDGIQVTARYKAATDDSVKTCRVTVGKEHDDQSTYVRIGDSDMICLIPTIVVRGILDFDPLLVKASDDICLISLSTVEAITITDGEGEYVFTVEKQGEHTFEYYLNGEKLDRNKFRDFFKELTGLKSVAVDEFAVATAGEPEITVVFKRNTAQFSELVLRLLPLDEESYLVDFGGMRSQIVLKSDVDEIIEAIKALR